MEGPIKLVFSASVSDNFPDLFLVEGTFLY